MIIFAIATDDLEQTVQNLEKILQYPLSNGGEHKMFGTHNRLFRLSDVYLEVIAINPNCDTFSAAKSGLILITFAASRAS